MPAAAAAVAARKDNMLIMYSTVDIILINITSLDNKSRNDIVYVNKKVLKRRKIEFTTKLLLLKKSQKLL